MTYLCVTERDGALYVEVHRGTEATTTARAELWHKGERIGAVVCRPEVMLTLQGKHVRCWVEVESGVEVRQT